MPKNSIPSKILLNTTFFRLHATNAGVFKPAQVNPNTSSNGNTKIAL